LDLLKKNEDIPSKLFEAAQRSGAEPEEASALQKARDAASRSAYLSGTYRLGGHGVASEALNTGESSSSNSASQQTAHVHLIMWSNGFSINDGPLRSYEDQENRSFLSDLMQKRTPSELTRMYPNQKIDLHMERRGTEYVAPKAKPFSGTGHRLGSVVPNIISSSSPTEVLDLEPNSETFLSGKNLEKTLKEAQDAVKVNENEPIGRIQIRVGNNAPFVGNFNHSHTVLDLRNFIVTAQPSLAFQPFSLVSGRPPCSIEDENKTLKNADIINAIVMVKFV